MLEKKYNLIQILRGFAAVFVMLYHATRHYQEKGLIFLDNFFRNGYFGVDIFFVLSGFVIYYSSRKYLENGNYLEFIKKRFIRIYPSFWIFLLVPLTLLFFISPQFIQDKTAFEFASYLKLFFLLFDHPQISQITWTLSFEMYFYLLFLLIVFNKKFRFLIAVILILAIINLVDKSLLPIVYLQKYLCSPLILEFFLGVLIVCIVQKFKKNNLLAFILILVFAISSFFMIHFLIANNLIYVNKHNRFLSFGIASFLLILSLVLIEKFNDFKSSKILIIIGDSSYVLYLIHSVILSFFDNKLILSSKIIVFNPTFSTLLVCVFIIIISVYMHLQIEKPMLKYFNKLLFKKSIQAL